MADIESKNRVVDITIAFLSGLTFFALLAFGLKIKPSQSETTTNQSDPGIYTLSENPYDCSREHAHLIKWLELKDPTHVSLTREGRAHHDFPTRNWVSRDTESKERQRQNNDERLRSPAVSASLVQQQLYTFIPRSPMRPPETLEAELIACERLRIDLPLPPASSPRPDAGVYVIDSTGRSLPEVPALELDALQGIDLTIKGATKLTIIPPSSGTGHPRVSITGSCGNPAMDLIALKHLVRWFRTLIVEKSNPHRVRWLIGPRQVAFIWKYVPGITYKPHVESAEKVKKNERNAG